MYCSKCGTQLTNDTIFCSACGQATGITAPIGIAAAAPSSSAPGLPGYAPAANAVPGTVARYTPTGAMLFVPPAYAGFWLRFVAYVIDGLIVSAAVGIVAAISIGFLGTEGIREAINEMAQGMNQPNPVFPWGFFAAIFVLVIVSLVAQWLYFAGMESSQSQGTLGKMALGLVVTDMNGQPISFARASGRFFSKLITGLVPFAIGYIMAGFTEKKQALHDMIASCLVLRKA